MLEIEIVSKAGTIVWEQYDEVKANLQNALVRYSNLVVTENDIKDAKEDMAQLNKLKDALDSERKRIKKEYLDPYNEFENQVKELEKMIVSARGEIKNQVDAFDEREKAEKLERIKRYFENTNFSLETFEYFYDSKWMNKTCSDKKWQDELQMAIDSYTGDWKTLETLAGSDVHKLVDLQSEYKRTGSVTQAIVFGESQARNREALLVAQEAQKEVVFEPISVAPIMNSTITNEPPAPLKSSEILIRKVEIHGTAEQIIMLGNFMKQNGIKFIKIEN